VTHSNKIFKKTRPWLWVGLLLFLPLLLLELWTGKWRSLPLDKSLFNYVSYTNSRNMDPQIAYFEARQDWEFVAIGSSEVRWGIDPNQIEAAIASQSINTHGFNLGLDGFNISLYKAILPGLNLPQRLPKLRVVLIGINLIETQRLLPENFDQGFSCDGILSRSVLTSAFAKDYGLYHLCNTLAWPTPLVAAIEKVSATIRYRQALRTLLLGYSRDSDIIHVASNGIEQFANGFFAHASIQAQPEEANIDQFLAEKKESPQKFKPLPQEDWPALLANNGFYNQVASYFHARKVLPVFFALPTNPLMIDTMNRRPDYERNSQLFQAWAIAQSQPTIFIDQGIQDDYNGLLDYSDYRHLSQSGALKFSRELGEQLSRNFEVIKALSNA